MNEIKLGTIGSGMIVHAEGICHTAACSRSRETAEKKAGILFPGKDMAASDTKEAADADD